MKLSSVLIKNYFPYARYTILHRAIPAIDGLKPVQRRILYSMFNLGLLNKNAKPMKSVRVVGDVMGKYHPHGDSSIYGALVTMSSGYEYFNTPYVKSKGSFGKVYSRDLKPASPRYTEARLDDICNEFFDGIKEDAVEFVNNFDDSFTEPVLLPVKFPSVLVNSSAGIAVGNSSNIPSFNLKNTCKATIDVLDEKITTPDELASVIGAPEFTTGGFLHTSDENLVKLCKTGRATFALTGRVELYSNKIVITEIPYNTTSEDIIESIEENIKIGNFKEIADIKDEIGKDGFKIVIDLKRGSNSREVAKDLIRYTPFNTKISFLTKVIIGNRYESLGVLDLIKEWIKFRINTIKRQYKFKIGVYKEKELYLSAWDIINDIIPEIVDMISKNNHDTAKEILENRYGLTDIQSNYILDLKLRTITKDRALKALKELEELRSEVNRLNEIINNDELIKNIIKEELIEIISKYGKDSKTTKVGELEKEDTAKKEVVISDDLVSVVMTQSGYLKRLVSLNEISRLYENGDEREVARWSIRNNQHLLVFDKQGTIHKILVDDIDQGRGKLVDKIHEKIGLNKLTDIMYVDSCGDYSGYFNLVYPNGRGTRVNYSSASGKRKQYKSVYLPVGTERFWITKEDKFFMITNREKAAYIDLTSLGKFSNRSAFKVARPSNNEKFIKLHPLKDVPNVDIIDLSRYVNGYTVKIGNDILVLDEEAIARAKQHIKDMRERFEIADSLDEEQEKVKDDNSDTVDLSEI